jgi:hypothetical protein
LKASSDDTFGCCANFSQGGYAAEVCGFSLCVDFSVDPHNCGSCGNVCLSGVCYEGRCVRKRRPG